MVLMVVLAALVDFRLIQQFPPVLIPSLSLHDSTQRLF